MILRLSPWFGRSRGRLGVAAVVVAAASLCCPVAASAGQQPQLTTTGSSFAGVAIQDWQGEFNEDFGGNINFSVSNSVTGMDEFCGKTIAFGATDISYATEQANCFANQLPYTYQYLPDVAGGLSFEYNLTGTNGQQIKDLTLDAATIGGIFTGGISYWDDPAIAALNPGVPLPHERIVPYYRSDAAGENYLLGDYLANTDGTMLANFQREATVPIPPGQSYGDPQATWADFQSGNPGDQPNFPNLGHLVAATGSEGAQVGPEQHQGAISYVEYAYAIEANLPVASVVNADGYAVQPSYYNVAVALTQAILYSDLTQNLNGVFTNTNPDAYPVSAYSYLVAQCVQAQASAQNFTCDGSGTPTMSITDGAELAQFVAYIACQGQADMPKLGYSPIPANLVEDDFEAAGRLPGGTTPPPPTASNCDNPFVDGKLTAPTTGPKVVDTANPGVTAPTGGTAGGPSAGTTATAASAGTDNSGTATGPGGSASGASGGSSQSGAAATLPGEKVDGHRVGTTTPDTGQGGPSASQRQATLEAMAGLTMQRDGVAPDISLWTTVLAAAVVLPTAGLWWWRRRPRWTGAGDDAHGRQGDEPA